MSIINEKTGSPNLELDSAGNATSAIRTFNIIGEADEATVIAEFQASLLPVFLGLNLQNSSIDPNDESLNTWIGVANYSDEGTKSENQVLAGGGIVERFDINSRTVRIMASDFTTRYQTFNSSNPGGPPSNRDRDETPDFKNLIQVNNDGVVQGADIEIATLGFTISKQYDNALINTAFKRKLLQITNKVNSDPFRGWRAEEVRLLAIQDQDAGSNKTNITYRFLVGENLSDTLPDTRFSLGDVTEITKLGHEYIWVKYKDFRDPVSEALIKVPEFVYVETVYKFFDFNDATLGIG